LLLSACGRAATPLLQWWARARNLPLSIDICRPPARRSAANPPHAEAAVE